MDRSRSYSGSVPSNGSVKIGGLWKRSQCLSRFTRPNYRHRVFILTEQSLSYYCGTVDRVGQMKGRVCLDAIMAVEFVEESAFNLPHTLQVVHHSKKGGFVPLYITATDSAECSDWVSTLRQACYFNKDMMMHYHPGALLRNRWSCCQQHGKTSLGCQPTYYLLTRSSSRYAEMRRKDTLTGSQSSGRRSQSASLQRGERASNPPDTRLMPADGATAASARNGRGLSNSCFDLTHRQVQNRFEPAMRDAESHRSSQLSTEPSISMGCITLTRLSLSESTGPLSPLLVSVDQGPEAEAPEKTPVLRTEAKKRGSRFKVAPESTDTVAPRTTFPTSESQPHLNSHHKPAYPALPNRFDHSVSTHFTHSVQLPSPAITLTNSISSSPVTVPGTGYHCLTEPRRTRRTKTFLDTVSPSVRQQNSLSSSLNVLPAKPVLEPKVSVTDPNTIHV